MERLDHFYAPYHQGIHGTQLAAKLGGSESLLREWMDDLVNRYRTLPFPYSSFEVLEDVLSSRDGESSKLF